MVGRLAGIGCAVHVALDAVVTHTADVEHAALHEEVLVARDAVLDCLQHVDRTVLQLHVLRTLDGVLQLSVDVERTLALQFQVSFAVQSSLLRTRGGIGQRVLCAAFDAQLYALAVHDAEGCAAVDGRLVGQRQAVQFDGGLVRTSHVELAVGGRAAQGVGNLADAIVHLAALLDADVGSADSGCHVGGNVAADGDRGRCAVVADIDRVVADGRLIDIDAADVADSKRLTADVQRPSVVRIGHLPGECSRILDGDTARHHIQRLCLSEE